MKDRKPQSIIPIILYVLTLLLSVFFILALFSGFSTADFERIFNTDMLYLPSVYHDLFLDKNGLNGWHFSPSPYFFPDMPVYFLCMAIFNNLLISTFVVVLMQYLFFVFILKQIFRLLYPSMHYIYATWANLLLLLFFIPQFRSEYFEFSFYLFSVSCHLSAFLMSLIALFFTIKYLQGKKKSSLIWLSLIGFLTLISDRLFFITFLMPAMLTLIFYIKTYKKEVRNLLILNSIVIVSGFFVFRLISHNQIFEIEKPHSMMDFDNIRGSWEVLMGHMTFYFNYVKEVRNIILISLLSLIIQIIIYVVNLFRPRLRPDQALMHLFIIIFAVIVYFAPVINGNYTAVDTLRYNVYVFFLLVPCFVIVAQYLIGGLPIPEFLIWIKRMMLVLIISALAWYGAKSYHSAGLKAYFNYYPDKVKEIDQAVEKYKLKTGVASYWIARNATLFSRSGVRLVPVFDNLLPCYHNGNVNWFYQEDQVFDFIVLDYFADKEIYKEIVDSAIQTLPCDQVEIVRVAAFRYDPATLLPFYVRD